MILCKNGHLNPDGATYCAVCKVYIDSSAQAAPVAPQPPAVATLAPSTLIVGASGEASCELRLENASGVSDDYGLELTGQAAGFGSLQPADLSLAPGAVGTSRLTFRPDGSAPLGGELPFEVVARSRLVPDRPVSAQGLLTIAVAAPKGSLSAELIPQTSKGRTAGAHVLTVHNPGSTPVAVAVTAATSDEAVAVDVRPPTLAIGPGESASAQVRVRPRESFWLGRRIHRFRVTAAPDLALDGAMAQRGRIPVLVLIALVAALAALGAFLATRGGTSEREAVTTDRGGGTTDGGGGTTDTGGAGGHSYRSEVLKDDPIAYWRLDESSGTIAADSSGNVKKAHYVGGVTLGANGAFTSQSDSAAKFDGVDDWVDIPDVTLEDFTLEAWVQLSGAISSEDAIGGEVTRGQDVNFDNRRLRIFQPPADCAPGQQHIPGERCWDVLVSGIQAAPDRWTQWVITRSGSTLRLYMDGSQISAETLPWKDPFHLQGLARGRTGFLSGFLDEVAIYDHALDASRIRAHFNAR